MRHLDKNWLTNGLIDFEYKKYIILSYLKHVQQNFTDKKLFPVLNDLIDHHRNLKSIRDGKTFLKNKFRPRISNFNFKLLSIEYQPEINDSPMFSELEAIMEYGMLLFDKQIHNGNELLSEIKSTITIEPVGISPLYKKEGLLFMTLKNYRTVRIYQYTVNPLTVVNGRDDQIKTYYLNSERLSIANTFEKMKIEMIKKFKSLPNPATYAISTTINFPYEETYLPIAKKMLENQLAA